MSDQSSKDRAGLCTFTFEDGRHCSMLQTDNDAQLCYFHEQQERQHLKTYVANLKVCRFLDGEVHTASDLSAAFASLFCAGVQGYVEPKNTQALTRLGHLMLKTHLLAKAEYLSAYEADWGEVVAASTAYHPFERTLEDIGNPDSLVRGPLPADPEQPTQQQQPQAVEPPKPPNPTKPQKTSSTPPTPVPDSPGQTRSVSKGSTTPAKPRSANGPPTADDSTHNDPAEPATSEDDDSLQSLYELRQRLSHHFLKR